MSDPRLNQYTVDVEVSGSIEVVVEAADEGDARRKARYAFCMDEVDMDVNVGGATLTREAIDEDDMQLTPIEEAAFMLTGKIPPIAFERISAEQPAVPR